jgi:hypothetical protein
MEEPFEEEPFGEGFGEGFFRNEILEDEYSE